MELNTNQNQKNKGICMTTGEKIKRFRNLRGIPQKIPGLLSGINSAAIKNMSMVDIETVSDVLSLPLKMDEQSEAPTCDRCAPKGFRRCQAKYS